MKWAHSGGLGSDLVLREEAVELMPELRDAFPAVANITKLEVDFKELKKMLAYFPYLKLTCFMVPDPVTKIIKPQNFVQVHYTLRGLKDVFLTKP